jgi:hypothetical protein
MPHEIHAFLGRTNNQSRNPRRSTSRRAYQRPNSETIRLQIALGLLPHGEGRFLVAKEGKHDWVADAGLPPPSELIVRKGDSNPHGIATASPSSCSIRCAEANLLIFCGRLPGGSVLQCTLATSLFAHSRTNVNHQPPCPPSRPVSYNPAELRFLRGDGHAQRPGNQDHSLSDLLRRFR